MEEYADSVNDALWYGMLPGTVYFVGFETEPAEDASGAFAKRVIARFKWRQHDWNRHTKDGIVWKKVVDGVSGQPRYPYKDFIKLMIGRYIKLGHGLILPPIPGGQPAVGD